MAKPKNNLRFGCVPIQAGRDERLHVLHHRALVHVSSRDQRSLERGTGEGCSESLAAMAQALRCNASNLCVALGQLSQWGYLIKTVSPLDRRLRIFRVVYSDEELPISNHLRTVERFVRPDRLPRAKGVLCPENLQATENPNAAPDNEKGKREKKKGSGFRMWESEDFPRAVRLAIFEQALESGEAVLTRADHDAVLDVYGDHPPGHPDHDRAVRILDRFQVTDDDHHHDQHADEGVVT